MVFLLLVFRKENKILLSDTTKLNWIISCWVFYYLCLAIHRLDEKHPII